ncbi:MAG: hypothetical protein HYT87_16200 [Nitrospirae bacterium]|nr:hypothetical protein [Nitrospirota bacterium]
MNPRESERSPKTDLIGITGSRDHGITRLALTACCLMLTVAGCDNNSPLSSGLSAFDQMYLNRRPPLGKIYPVTLADENLERNILASTLQGTINRDEVRLYLIGGGKEGDRPWETDEDGMSARFWMNVYRDRYGVKWEDSIDLSGALSLFGSSVRRVYLVSAKEPWSLHIAHAMAAVDPGVILFDSIEDTAAAYLPSAERVDLRGMFKSESEALAEVERRLRGQTFPRLADLTPTEFRLRDFLIQQGVMTAYARPLMEQWEKVRSLFNLLPAVTPIYGYIALNGVEEFLAVKAISEAGLFLVPSDTTSNLSVHSAVVPSQPPSVPHAAVGGSGSICSSGKARFVVAISDADNVSIPFNRYVRPDYWESPLRGALPVGWSIGLSLLALGPAAMDYYLSGVTPNDEWVSMMGIGYALPAYHRSAEEFMRKSFETAGRLGLTSTWFLDVPLLTASDPTWKTIAAVEAGTANKGFLVGYVEFPGSKSFQYGDGKWALAVASQYEDTPATFADRINAVLNGSSARGDPITFLSASVWGNTYEGLAQTLPSLESSGARFLLPSEAFACLN